MQMTYEQYDAMIERMGTISAPKIYPSPIDIELMEHDPETWLLYAIYLFTYNEKPKNKAEEYSRKSLNAFIYDNLELID